MLHNIYYQSSDNRSTVHACIWEPEGEPKGILQIIHGMCEYAERYAPFAEYLNSKGYLVVAEDHLGHGETAKSPEQLGYFDDAHDFMTVIQDIRYLQQRVSAKAVGVPYFVMGHSMGSFFCRVFISIFGDELDGAIIMGTGFQGSMLLGTAKTLVRLNAACYGWNNRSKFVKSLAFGSYNKKWGGGDGFAWLSVNEDNRKAYEADPLCGFDFTDNGYAVLFSVIKSACSGKTFKGAPDKLPILIVSGQEDPVGSYGKAVEKVYNKYIKAGKTAKIKLYEGVRHEILNDNSRDEVRADLLAFMDEECLHPVAAEAIKNAIVIQ